MNTKNIKQVLARMEKCKEEISKQRDILRDLHSQIADLLDPLDDGLHDISEGMLQIENGLESISTTY